MAQRRESNENPKRVQKDYNQAHPPVQQSCEVAYRGLLERVKE